MAHDPVTLNIFVVCCGLALGCVYGTMVVVVLDIASNSVRCHITWLCFAGTGLLSFVYLTTSITNILFVFPLFFFFFFFFLLKSHS